MILKTNTKIVSLKNVIIVFFIILFVFPFLASGKTNSLKILKKEDTRITKHFQKIKRLPNIYREKFQIRKERKKFLKRKGDEYEVNLLVLLVDFPQEEPDNPKTTGNGKFDFSKYDYFNDENGELDSVRTVGSPPHDSTYFHQCIVAMQYYYQTASLGVLNSFDPLQPVNFHFKIFPNKADTAYHLPQKMAYYYPDTEDWGLKTERLTEYFKDAIISADTTNFPQTPDINFSDYNHIMLIHAGSDWQHDVFWDTPCDLPAFFISLEEDSIAVTDANGDTTYIKEAASVPETMSQDFYKSGHLQFGFAALNAEIVHEFGHSLGLVDLYNTNNSYPAVGYWDIMDSGGMTAVISIDTAATPQDTIVIEGALPILPSVWSRLLIWEDAFKNSGKYVEVTSPKEILVDAAEFPFAANPQFIKIPINDEEYFLLENRETDIDGDGTTGIKLDDVTERVPLYPADTTSWLPNNEYDFMLPTYDPYLEAETNGGLCIWHIDDYVIYDEIVYVDGKPYSRFEANCVNGSYSRRGIKLIEADGIEDIGNPTNPYAYVFGCPYDPFFKTKPGIWTPGDSNRFHNYHFGPTTTPNSFSNENINSLIEIFDISNYGTTMCCKFQYQLYSNIKSITTEYKFNTNNQILFFNDPIFQSKNIAFISDSMLTINNDILGDFTYSFDKKITQPISLLNRQPDHFIIVAFKDSIALVNFNLTNYPPLSSFGTYTCEHDIISDSPIALSEDKILVLTENLLTLYKIKNDNLLFCREKEANKPRIAYNNSKQEIVVLNYPNTIAIYDTSLSIPPIAEFSISSHFGEFYPVIENKDTTQIIFFQDAVGSIYKIENDKIEKIFAEESYNFSKISNIALGDVNNDGIHDIVFTADNTIFALQPNGALLEKFPITPNAVNYSSSVSPIIGKSLLPENISLFLPTASSWTQAISEDCVIVPEYSFSLGYSYSSPYINFTDDSTYIYLPVSDSIIKVFSFNNVSLSENTIYWNGYKNGPERWSCLNETTKGKPDSIEYLQIIAFPNPAKKGDVRIRINSPEETYSSIHIYNLTAKLLFQDVQEIKPDINNEYVWNIDKISSGIYFAIVKVGSQKRLVKVGVIK